MTQLITAPLLNANEDSALLCSWLKPDKTLVMKGEVIAVFETSKAAIDLESEHSGYLHIFVREGSEVAVGQVVAALCDTADEMPEIPSSTKAPGHGSANERKITKKAKIVAAKARLDLDQLRLEIPGNGTITEADLAAYLERRGTKTSSAESGLNDLVDDLYPSSRRQRLLIIGGGLGAVQVLDSLSRIELQQATGIVDDNRSLVGKTILNVPILGGREIIEDLFKEKLFDAAVISVSTSIEFRAQMSETLLGLNIPMANIIDPSARVQQNAVMGVGNVILAYCQIGSCATIGNGNFLSPYVDIEHHCSVGDFCTFGPGVMMSSLVRIESRVKFGTGIFIEPKLEIGANSIVGSGAIITRNIPRDSILKTKINYTLRPRTSSPASKE